jgi:hypothetical protein
MVIVPKPQLHLCSASDGIGTAAADDSRSGKSHDRLVIREGRQEWRPVETDYAQGLIDVFQRIADSRRIDSLKSRDQVVGEVHDILHCSLPQHCMRK